MKKDKTKKKTKRKAKSPISKTKWKKPKKIKEKGTSRWIMLLGSSRGFGFLIFCFFLLVILISLLYVSQKFKVRTVYVQGNKHYTNEEIQNMVMSGKLGDNSIFLSLKYRNKGVENVPFVEKMDVEIMSPDTIKIYVYEKALAGYVEYLGRNMYFDKDGIIVESSAEKTLGIPQVTGLDFGYVVLYEKLPVENDTVFRLVLNITQVLNKYELATDRIYFDSKYQITLYFGDAKAKIGAYTDKVGNDASNLKLSQSRAEAVKAAVGSAQVVEAKGYGEEFATVAETASDKEREADRKTAIRLTK